MWAGKHIRGMRERDKKNLYAWERGTVEAHSCVHRKIKEIGDCV